MMKDDDDNYEDDGNEPSECVNDHGVVDFSL